MPPAIYRSAGCLGLGLGWISLPAIVSACSLVSLGFLPGSACTACLDFWVLPTGSLYYGCLHIYCWNNLLYLPADSCDFAGDFHYLGLCGCISFSPGRFCVLWAWEWEEVGDSLPALDFSLPTHRSLPGDFLGLHLRSFCTWISCSLSGGFISLPSG